MTQTAEGEVYFIYDGDCPICRTAAYALRIRQSVGKLHLINAREGVNQPLVSEVTQLGYNLDEGMVIKFSERYYHGADALNIMALLGSESGWFNRMNAILFRSPQVAKILYPMMRGTRNVLIGLKGVDKLNNLANTNQMPIFQSIFGQAWETMPSVMQKRYSNRPYTNDTVRIDGVMDISLSNWMLCFSPILKWLHLLVPYQGRDIPTTVIFRSEPNSRAFCFDREFRFPGKKPYRFYSRMLPVGGNEIIEYLALNIGWRAAYDFIDGKVILSHRGYVWRLLGYNIPLPFHLVFGKGHAEETPLSETSFKMYMGLRYPWFGEIYKYTGNFEVQRGRAE